VTLTLVLGALSLLVAGHVDARPPAPITCAHHLKEIGCLRVSPQGSFMGGSCNVWIYGNNRWLWGQEGNSRIAHAGRVAPGDWRVVTPFGSGSAIRLRPRLWRITSRGRIAAYAHGPDGPAVALMLLGWGWDCFPDH
jgi:hypothetical protein